MNDVRSTTGSKVTCPVCLHEFSCAEQPRLQWDVAKGRYVELNFAVGVSGAERARRERNAVIRCPDPEGAMGEHFLSADYDQYGQPVIIGFIGATHSGKSHLLTAMVAAIERGGLSALGSRPLDLAVHQRFIRERVKPLIEDSARLPSTEEGVVSFADAFVIGRPGAKRRAVVLFDVAGGDLASVYDSKRFLEIVDGLVFVVDPTQLRRDGAGDESFNAVLNLLQKAERLPHIAAAVVLNKADLLRFDDPVARWLRLGDEQFSADLTLRESADVYAYLDSRGAEAWARPYRECGKATLHIASATGGADDGEAYPRGVAPCRVLNPLLAVLAMTGVATDPETQAIGI